MASRGIKKVVMADTGERASINLRISKPLRTLIDTAAASVGKSRTEFMLESARQNAIDVLLDQQLFLLNDQQFEAFERALSNPSPANARLNQLIVQKSPWEK